MTIKVLQDHTDFLTRMLEHAADQPNGKPLNITVLEAIRKACVGAKYQRQVHTRGQLELLARTADEKTKRKLTIVMAEAVELEVESWYCVANPEVLTGLHVGPVVSWNGASWWGKLKGVECPVEIEFDDRFTKRKNTQRGAVRPAPQQEQSPRAVVGAGLLGMVGR